MGVKKKRGSSGLRVAPHGAKGWERVRRHLDQEEAVTMELSGAFLAQMRPRMPDEPGRVGLTEQRFASLAAFDPDADPPLGPPWQLADSSSVGSAYERLTRTPTGFAVVWSEQRPADEVSKPRLMIVDCCAAR